MSAEAGGPRRDRTPQETAPPQGQAPGTGTAAGPGRVRAAGEPERTSSRSEQSEQSEQSEKTSPQPEQSEQTPVRPERSEQVSEKTEKASGEPQATSGEPRETSGEAGEPEIEVLDPISAPDAEGRPRRATRRFPLFTRDTARPEGGGRAAAGDAPAPARQWPLLSVLIAVGLGLLVTALDAFRVGLLLIGAGLLGGAVLRWMLPRVGMLAVRSRFTDIVTYGVLGVAIVLLALMAQPKPWLEIPFLDDALHFTVRNS
ncbi:hypothetical protein GCM10023336_34530 [Streptomyces similanensis]|uniref:DUF3017 domain-containing protein n=1 Tax=Streptomyces similanensis TaxID=1274988 RepID=A0ABP9KLT0_9ACTN